MRTFLPIGKNYNFCISTRVIPRIFRNEIYYIRFIFENKKTLSFDKTEMVSFLQTDLLYHNILSQETKIIVSAMKAIFKTDKNYGQFNIYGS